MEGVSGNGVACPQLLDLMSNNREWLVMIDEAKARGSTEEKKLELRLGPPGTDDWFNQKQDMNGKGRDEALLSFCHFPSMASTQIATNNGGHQAQKFGSSEALASPWTGTNYKENCQKLQEQEQMKPPRSYYQFPSTISQSKNLPFLPKEASQPNCSNKGMNLQDSGMKKAFSQASVSAANTAVPSVSQKRTAPGPVVGWPPIRSFRKNITSNSSTKPSPEPQNETPNKVAREDKPVETCERKGMFVKINMDGVPIGRKVDLKAYDSYEKLSSAVDELFRGLLAAQKDSSAGGISKKQEEEKPIAGVLDGRGEYTLVYEDNEGDRMLVGDVPWHMFVSTVKRLRVLKSSEVSAMCLGTKHGKNSHEMKN
ncbi:auxin-responsive protein IAA6-like [Syzygium oleosum]|uniref:auxin-responsive protein IAA6-like n=1 Tax=Syzygium oleosum TaxID=219896 RepID=UPI0011D196CB|nr:auxin-responsive protein IAA6-like [Syzygium oleosum]XP_056176469.1 auxin-responsive protein IAA6-like [Syzygium oleosum]